ncbi:MAG: Rrf2 family transcriptional regulator [Candidatus Obscuribacterales bacterium]|nr:Rrf2 family transcriptional regulator [Cyanobacteria bacterium SZAS LIN-5]
MISQTAEYALRAVVLLAMHPESSFTTQQIAQSTKVPFAYLSKVLQALVRANLMRSQRGLGGGFTLAQPASAITILSVINAVDPIARITTCPLGLEEHGLNLCALHKRLDDATAMVEKVFADTTIGDLLLRPTSSVPLCEQQTCGHSR